jgi:uncharacterized integral membrane protein
MRTSRMKPSDRTAQRSATRKVSPRTITAAVLGGLIVLFAALNSQSVTIHWLVSTTQTPLFVVIAACGLVGFAAGWLVAHRASGRKSR